MVCANLWLNIVIFYIEHVKMFHKTNVPNISWSPVEALGAWLFWFLTDQLGYKLSVCIGLAVISLYSQ